MQLWRRNKVTKAELSLIDSDHEIEEFLQEFVVEKVTSKYEENIKSIKEDVNKINEIIKNSSNATTRDIDTITGIVRDLCLELSDIDDILKKIKKIDTAINDQTGIINDKIQNYDNIIEDLPKKWTEKLNPMQSDVTKLLSCVTELGNGIASLSEEILGKLPQYEESLNCQYGNITAIKENVDQVNKQVSVNNDKLLKNDSLIVNSIVDLNQKMKWMWITVGADTLLIVGLFISLLCR